MSLFRQELKWSPGGWFCRGWGSFHIFLPPLCHKEAACGRLVGTGDSFQLSACSRAFPHPPQPLISHLPPGCWRQDVNQTLWTFNFVLSCKLESTQQYPPSWNLPDPSPGPSSCQPLKCLPSGRPLDPAYPSFGLLPLCRSLAGSGLGLLASLHPLNLPWRGGTWQARPSACSGFVLFGN